MMAQANLRLDKELLDWLKEQAKKDKRSLNNYLCILLANEMERREGDDDEKL